MGAGGPWPWPRPGAPAFWNPMAPKDQSFQPPFGRSPAPVYWNGQANISPEVPPTPPPDPSTCPISFDDDPLGYDDIHITISGAIRCDSGFGFPEINREYVLEDAGGGNWTCDFGGEDELYTYAGRLTFNCDFGIQGNMFRSNPLGEYSTQFWNSGSGIPDTHILSNNLNDCFPLDVVPAPSDILGTLTWFAVPHFTG